MGEREGGRELFSFFKHKEVWGKHLEEKIRKVLCRRCFHLVPGTEVGFTPVRLGTYADGREQVRLRWRWEKL